MVMVTVWTPKREEKMYSSSPLLVGTQLQCCMCLIMGEERPGIEICTELLIMADLARLWWSLPMAAGNGRLAGM